mmetsp:Transcript_60230/g.196838  ORF Transcript_60230/g.196838 Transcript_60230/m.196838 type:complete len:357 (-) Transcript_60230:78-1148(-)
MFACRTSPCRPPSSGAMGGEIHAYGTSLGCISRRLFVLWVSTVMAALCYVQLFKWAMRSHLWDSIIGNAWEVGPESSCTGMQCYEMLTCFGLKDATRHTREPLATLAGAVLLPLGVAGAHQCYRWHLRVLGLFLAASAALHAGLMFCDAAYVHACGTYPSNMIHQTMVNWMPPSPVTLAAQGGLLKMSSYSFKDVADITDGFNVLLWYCSVAGTLTAFLTYAALETNLLATLAERGPLGLGMHYGLGQWDEYLNHDAVRRHKDKGMRSTFIDDAKLPSIGSQDTFADANFASYGSVGGGPAPVQVLLQDRPEDEDDYDDYYEDDEEAVAAAAAADTPPTSAAGQEIPSGQYGYGSY